MSKKVYQQVAELHMRSLGDTVFAPSISIGFLALLYETIDNADDTVLLTEIQDGQVIGFLAGRTGHEAMYRHMLRSPMRLAMALAPALVQPVTLRRIAHRVRRSKTAVLPQGLPEAEVLSLAVTPERRGSYVAERLYRRMLAEFLSWEIRALRVTVCDRLLQAHAFYQRMGAVVVAHVEVGGEPSTVYVHRL